MKKLIKILIATLITVSLVYVGSVFYLVYAMSEFTKAIVGAP